MANSSIILSNLDFDTLKNTFKAYMKSQDRFNDYDFDGSNMNVLMDLLAYNTFQNSFYLNMIGNEMFLDSAQLRDSVVSHAKELNYTPRSFKSAEANVSIVITSTNTSKRSIVVPKGTTFSSRFGTRTFTFSTGENIIVDNYTLNSNNTITFNSPDITLYEGFYLTDTYTTNYRDPQRFLISNKNVDISSLSVTVLEDNGASTLYYQRAQSLFDLDETSRVFFVQGAENDSYEIVFGDGVTGRQPKDNSVIIIEYRISNGELPNGCNTFRPDSTIDGETNILVNVNSAATSGAVSESIDSIKFNAPRHFSTQERAVTTSDYETLLKLNFPEINTVTAYGGETLDPPQFGKVFVAVDLNEVDGLPNVKKTEYYRFLKPRSPVSIDPVFVDPSYTYINVVSRVKYNINTTKLTSDDIRTIVSSGIIDYAQTNLNNFNKVFRYSNLVRVIDTAQLSIVSNETYIRLIKVLVPTLASREPFDVSFETQLDTVRSVTTGGITITSSEFIYRGQRAVLQDDGNGNLQTVSTLNNLIISSGIGTVNYDTGLLQFTNFPIDNYFGTGIKIYAIPRDKDVATTNNVILNIIEEDLDLTIEPVRV